MLIAVIVLSVLLVIMSYFYATTRINNYWLCVDFGNIIDGFVNDLEEADRNYKALEQGRDEETEAYEQQYLSFMETIENQSNAINSYIEDLHFLVQLGEKHFEHCLPDLGDETKQRFENIKASVLL